MAALSGRPVHSTKGPPGFAARVPGTLAPLPQARLCGPRVPRSKGTAWRSGVASRQRAGLRSPKVLLLLRRAAAEVIRGAHSCTRPSAAPLRRAALLDNAVWLWTVTRQSAVSTTGLERAPAVGARGARVDRRQHDAAREARSGRRAPRGADQGGERGEGSEARRRAAREEALARAGLPRKGQGGRQGTLSGEEPDPCAVV
jgi:hypothetical protein